ncbi:NAD(P)H-dependent oxidoreductase [Kineosporia sp. NBRC 101731]|uniref:NADPH-dependent FMN reductase n=1 Tax=Kineosporia sp. NBRC 101731 TaxID=3032199 RepID=UPI0024A199CC|nr:NAD(P)H-dependent oxidoreductase [Kineosporia sp. NBRC 101731]GLY32460.1 FMN reductase [Kineosporia sp. NBRC 101731]
MSQEPIQLAVIIGSVRAGRFGPAVTQWFAGQTRDHSAVTVDVIDLEQYPLPLRMPDFGEEPPVEVAPVKNALGERLQRADAYVVVTPEYNHAPPAALKNAIDWYRSEWAAKPVGLISYGGLSGGLRAAEHLRQIFAELHAMTVRDAVSFHHAWNDFTHEGEPSSPEGSEAAAKVLLDQLVWWGVALRDARRARPYNV